MNEHPPRQYSPRSVFDQLVADLAGQYGTGEARSIARIVFEDAFGTRRPEQKEFTAEEEHRFLEIRQRLLSGEPLQYVLGVAGFFGLRFRVSPAVLIPRQETEELVAWVLDWLKACAGTAPAVLDVGLGSGCIAITLMDKRPDLRLFGLEISPAALALATENARRITPNAAYSFLEGDILDPKSWTQFPVLDVVVSNPPYIPLREKALMPDHVTRWEPHSALFVHDPNPLVFYQAIASFALEKLRPGGALFFECNEFNAPDVVDLLRSAGFVRVELRRDLAGADRMVAGICP